MPLLFISLETFNHIHTSCTISIVYPYLHDFMSIYLYGMLSSLYPYTESISLAFLYFSEMGVYHIKLD